MFCAYTRPRYQVSVYRTIGPLVYFARKIDYMTFLVDDNQANVIEAFNSTSRYIDDLLNIDNP